ncbi:MAG: hypothetical protein HY901_18185 [Deltaproteobacteria bacterium]|nr:hypothetical protein [Deltaproteobacteria bacterium]
MLDNLPGPKMRCALSVVALLALTGADDCVDTCTGTDCEPTADPALTPCVRDCAKVYGCELCLVDSVGDCVSHDQCVSSCQASTTLAGFLECAGQVSGCDKATINQCFSVSTSGSKSYSGSGTFQFTMSNASSSATCTDIVQINGTVDSLPGWVEIKFSHQRFQLHEAVDGTITCTVDPSESVAEDFYATSHDDAGNFLMNGWLPGRFDDSVLSGEGSQAAPYGSTNTTQTYLRFSLARVP